MHSYRQFGNAELMPAPQISTWERLRQLKDMRPRGDGGRPTLCNAEIAKEILKYLAQGNYLTTSCEAAGVDYRTVREWIVKAARDREAGVESPYTQFGDELTRAQAAAETGLVEAVRVAPDWRAQFALLQYGPGRSRWGKTEQVSGNTNVIVLDSSAVSGLADALAVAAQRRLGPVVEGELIEQNSAEPATSSGDQDS